MLNRRLVKGRPVLFVLLRQLATDGVVQLRVVDDADKLREDCGGGGQAALGRVA